MIVCEEKFFSARICVLIFMCFIKKISFYYEVQESQNKCKKNQSAV